MNLKISSQKEMWKRPEETISDYDYRHVWAQIVFPGYIHIPFPWFF